MRKAIIDLKPQRDRGRGQHAGLLLQRFLAEPAAGKSGNPDEKRAVITAAITAAGDPELIGFYKSALERWEKSLPELHASNVFKTDSRLIVGLGSENVLETGIHLHHTYGLPVIPGSALKGLAAHYCHEVWGQLSSEDAATVESKRFRRGWIEEKYEYHKLLFGTTDDSGALIFHDAWLVPGSSGPLVRDVMTPHHPAWLDAAKPPTDFDSPIPVPFVSVAGTFRIAVSWHGPMSEKAACWTELAFDLLAEALREWGVGGKTSSGYGRLTEVNPNQRRKPFSAEALGLPSINAVVIATLLDAPKKNKPWRAKTPLRTGKELSGPIEPIEQTPKDAAPGKIVRLVVTHVDEKSIRFTWSK